MVRRIAVLAGTPVDTKMGVDFLSRHGYYTLEGATASNPKEQSYLQMFDKEKLYNITHDIIISLSKKGADAAFIYCNSLSCALDLKRLRHESPIPIITPLDAYVVILKNYDFVGILAANGQSIDGLEEICLNANSNLKIVGASILPIVEEVEKGILPRSIVCERGIAAISKGFKDIGGQCIILGCTHFPYFIKELSKEEILPIYNPSLVMLDILNNRINK